MKKTREKHVKKVMRAMQAMRRTPPVVPLKKLQNAGLQAGGWRLEAEDHQTTQENLETLHCVPKARWRIQEYNYYTRRIKF